MKKKNISEYNLRFLQKNKYYIRLETGINTELLLRENHDRGVEDNDQRYIYK